MTGSVKVPATWARGRLGRFAVLVAVLAALSVGLVAAVASHWVWTAAEGRLYDNLALAPAYPVALVLGCPPLVAGGHANAYFEARVRAAARLFHAGKVQHLLVSGDNGDLSYNEPKAMIDALVARGVPEERIVADYAGFRTLDSIVRAKQVFGQDRLIVVSQEFHNRRALFLADRSGVDASAYNAADVERGLTARLRWREAFARVVAVADTYLLGTEPKFLGEPIEIGPSEAGEQSVETMTTAADRARAVGDDASGLGGFAGGGTETSNRRRSEQGSDSLLTRTSP